MDRFTEMALFVEVADRGSLGAAAEALGLSNPAATRYLASLEERLQVRLVERNTRRLYLTSEGPFSGGSWMCSSGLGWGGC